MKGSHFGNFVPSYYPHNPAYDELWIHDIMVNDEVRTGVYKRAIEAYVCPGDVVADVGTGTGILAFFAAKAGAKKVYAIESTPIIEVARKIAADNGLEERITFIEGDASEIRLLEQVDWIVSEWMGVFAFQENMLPSLLSIRDRYLKKNGGMLPSHLKLYIVPVGSPSAHNIISKWEQFPYGIDTKHLAEMQAHNVHVYGFQPQELLSDPQIVFDLDMKNMKFQPPYEAYASFRINKGTECHGLAGWFLAQFGQIVLDTSPSTTLTCWNQSYFPIRYPIKVTTGDKVNVNFKVSPDPSEPKLMHFRREIGYLSETGYTTVTFEN